MSVKVPQFREKYVIYPIHQLQAGYDTRSIFKWGIAGLNSEFSFSSTGYCLHFYLPITAGRTDVLMPFLRVLERSEWLCDTNLISWDNNRYAKCTFSGKKVKLK